MLSLLRFFRHNGHKPGRCCADVASLEFFRVPDLAVARRRRGGQLRLCPAPLAVLSRCLAPLPRLQNTKRLRKTTHFFDVVRKLSRALCFFDLQSDAIELISRWRVGLDPNRRRKNTRTEMISKKSPKKRKNRKNLHGSRVEPGPSN